MEPRREEMGEIRREEMGEIRGNDSTVPSDNGGQFSRQFGKAVRNYTWVCGKNEGVRCCGGARLRGGGEEAKCQEREIKEDRGARGAINND